MTHLSRHVSNDDLRHFRFVRNTGLPVGTFPRGKRSPDWWVVAACLAGALLLVMATGAI